MDAVAKKLRHVAVELKEHAPFTMLGALSGVVMMLFLKDLGERVQFTLFYVLHPAHVAMSAVVTTSMFRLHARKASPWVVVLGGYVGSIGIATLSDSLIPYAGERLLGIEAHHHIGFIERWYIVNPVALGAIGLAYAWPATRFPHAGHVFVSTWASLFHVLMALGGSASLLTYVAVCVFLFLAVWLPCCISDIVFPLLFVTPEDHPAKRLHVH